MDTYARSSDRSPRLRAGVPANTVGRNTDFQHLFSADDNNRCWYHNDLLELDPSVYHNAHWPTEPTRRTVPYRSTMVWPIRKMLREGSSTRPNEFHIHGFLTVDSPLAGVLDYDRHFELGAAFADHLLAVLWDPEDLRRVHAAINASGGTGPSAPYRSSATTNDNR